MAKPKGSPKTGGKKKGYKNPFKQTVKEICEEKGYSPIETLIDLAMNEQSQWQFNAAKELAAYIYPKKTAVTVSGPGDGPIKTKTESSYDDRLLDDFERLLETKLNETKRS